MDISQLDIHTEEQFRDTLRRAGRVIECSWFVGVIRQKTDNKWVPILMFADEDNKEFAYAFLIRGGAMMAAIVADLQAAQRRCDAGDF